MTEYDGEPDIDKWTAGSITNKEFFINSGVSDYKTIMSYLVEKHLQKDDYAGCRWDFISFFM
jgi:hypothetical protein